MIKYFPYSSSLLSVFMLNVVRIFHGRVCVFRGITRTGVYSSSLACGVLFSGFRDCRFCLNSFPAIPQPRWSFNFYLFSWSDVSIDPSPFHLFTANEANSVLLGFYLKLESSIFFLSLSSWKRHCILNRLVVEKYRKALWKRRRDVRPRWRKGVQTIKVDWWGETGHLQW